MQNRYLYHSFCLDGIEENILWSFQRKLKKNVFIQTLFTVTVNLLCVYGLENVLKEMSCFCFSSLRNHQRARPKTKRASSKEGTNRRQ